MESPNQDKGITESMLTCLKVRSELHNIGKSLQCPLCLSTLQSPTLLPCNHAFCKSCILANFDPINNRTISASSGKATYKNQCPVCKISCNKRGMNESDHLGDIVRAYKKTLRSFGLTPIAYDDKEGITMTQIEESFDYDNHSEDDTSKEVAKAPSLNQCYEHLEVARGMRDQLELAVKTMEANFDSANDSSHQNKVKEMEKRNEMKKYQFLLEDQNKVVKADNRFLLEAAVKKQKRHKSTETAKVAFAQDLESSEIPTEASGNVHLGQKSDDSVDSEKSNCQLCSQDEIEEEHDDDDTVEQVENTQSRFSRALNAIQMSDFALSEIPEFQNQESQEFYSLDQGVGAKNLSQGDIIMTTQDMMDEVREKEAADRSGEWHEKEVELEEQLNNRLQENTEEKISANENTEDKKSSSVSSTALEATLNGRNKASSQLSERFFTAESQQEDQEKEENSVTQNKNTCTFAKGTIVIVADRTWPGVNKIGGVAKVQRVHTSEAGVKYDVAYVLGGREKLVDSAFVKHHIEDSGSFISETKKTESTNTKVEQDSTTSSTIGTNSRTRKSRRVDERKMVEQWVAIIDAEEEKSEKKNKSKPKDGIIQIKPMSKESKSKRKLGEDDENNTSDNTEQKSRSKRKRTARSTKISVNNSIESSTIKKTSTVVEKIADKSQSQEILESNNSCTFQEIFDAASKKYQPILETGGSKKKIFITTSSLSNNENKIVKEMARQFTKTNVPVKLLQDFNPYKTNILITPSQLSSGDKRAGMRTMKAMRAALNGIPIIDPSWCQSCIKEDKLLFDRAYCISSLPTKVPLYTSNVENVSEVLDLPRDFPTASYGVFAAAASTKPLFGNELFYLTGNEWKSNTTMAKDVKLLIVEGGGGILTSVQQVTKAIERDIDDQRSSIVILCDGSQTDSTSGITKPLSKVISNAIKSGSKISSVTVVNSKWIFDCISCAMLLEHEHYPPDSPSAKKMWRLQGESTDGDEMENV